MSDRDLFDDSTMSFGEHLEELRQRLINALVGVAIGAVVGFLIGGWVIAQIKAPLVATLNRYEYRTLAEAAGSLSEEGGWAWVKKWTGMSFFDDVPAPGIDEDELEGMQKDPGGLDESPSVKDTLRVAVDRAELRRLLHASDPDAFPRPGPGAGDDEPEAAEEPGDESVEPPPADGEPPMMVTLRHPLFAEIRQDLRSRSRPVTLEVTEGFFTYLKVSLVTGVVLASPWIFYQAWLFVAAGLYPHERKYVYKFGPLSFGLFAVGAVFAWFAVIPFALDFFIGFSNSLGFETPIQIGPWITFAVTLPLIFGLAFQMPLLMLLLERIGVFEVADFREKRRMAIFVICIASALLTPSDPITLILMAVPLSLLYELGIFLCLASPQRSQFADVPT